MTTIRTIENAEYMIEGITNGTPLRQLCRELEISKSAVYDWLDEDEEFAGRIAQARARGFDQIAEEALEIIDAEPERIVTMMGEDRSESRIDSASVQRAKNQAETRLKLLAKWDPKRYGDAMLHKHADADGEKLPLDEVTRAARFAAIANQINAQREKINDASD